MLNTNDIKRRKFRPPSIESKIQMIRSRTGRYFLMFALTVFGGCKTDGFNPLKVEAASVRAPTWRKFAGVSIFGSRQRAQQALPA